MVKRSTIAYLLFAAVVIAAVFSGGYFAGLSQAKPASAVARSSTSVPPIGANGIHDLGIFWDVWRSLENRFYKGKEGLDEHEMVYGAIRGMVKSVGDPYTEFMDPQKAKQFLDDIKGEFEGIGAEIGIRKEQLVVVAPLKGMPAERVGLKPGDKILQIDGQATFDLSLDEAVRRIRGPRGTIVTLLILRNGEGKPQEFKVTRDVIRVPVVDSEVIEGNIGLVRLFHFTETAFGEFRRATNELLNRGIKKMVLDLRGNPGGFLEVAVDIAGMFLEPGEIVVTEQPGKGEPKHYRANGTPTLSSIKVVVLINEGSASASEILAGALRDQLKIPLVGKKSFGKGSIQDVERFRDESTLKVTIAQWLTPSGAQINEKGLEPDYSVEFKEEDAEVKRDPQLDKAIELLR